MDSITHGLLGAAIAECGFRDRLGRGATLMGAVGGLLPDSDIFLAWVDPWWAWEYHRHITHSLFFAPVVAPVLAWLFWRRKGRQHYALWCLCAYLAIGIHPLLDLCTSYGTQLFEPFSNLRLALDWIAIIDPAYSFILLGIVIGCAWLRGAGHGPRTQRLAIKGMILSAAYLGCGAIQNHRALGRLYEVARFHDHHVLAARAIPQVGSLFVWRLIYRTENAYYVGRTNLRFDHRPGFFYLPVEDGPLICKADGLPRVKFFRRFTMGWALPRVVQTGSGRSVIYDDLRYSWQPDSPESLWSVVVDFDRDDRVLSVRRAGHRRNGSFIELLRSIWREIGRP
jgi:inner membrane protein